MATREWVAGEIGIRLATPLADAEMGADDSTTNLKEPIDDALRLLGYGEDDIPTADHGSAYELLVAVRYTTLRAILERITDRFDITTGGDAFRLSQTIENVKAMLTRAEADLSGIASGDDFYSLDLSFLAGGAGLTGESFG
jgi:hypothetical protein